MSNLVLKFNLKMNEIFKQLVEHRAYKINSAPVVGDYQRSPVRRPPVYPRYPVLLPVDFMRSQCLWEVCGGFRSIAPLVQFDAPIDGWSDGDYELIDDPLADLEYLGSDYHGGSTRSASPMESDAPSPVVPLDPVPDVDLMEDVDLDDIDFLEGVDDFSEADTDVEDDGEEEGEDDDDKEVLGAEDVGEEELVGAALVIGGDEGDRAEFIATVVFGVVLLFSLIAEQFV